MMVATVALGATLITGCATMDRAHDDGMMPVSALAYTPVTDPVELVKWSGSLFHDRLQSIDTYYFVVPDTRYHAGPAFADRPGRPMLDRSFRDDVGSPGPYQYETGGYRVIRHQPGHQR
jgi:hypothetical protein